MYALTQSIKETVTPQPGTVPRPQKPLRSSSIRQEPLRFSRVKSPVTHNEDHDDVIKWKHFPRYWPFVRGIHWSPVNSPHKGQWRGALMFSLICVWINDWVNDREAGDLRRNRRHYDVTVMYDANIESKRTQRWHLYHVRYFTIPAAPFTNMV